MIDGLFTNFSVLQKALDASSVRNKVISNNIANVDTPNFKKSSVSFEDVLNEKLKSSNNVDTNNLDDIVADVNPTVQVENSGDSMRVDGNNVDIDAEMSELSKNTIRYNTLIQEMSSSFKRLSIVINGGR